MTPVSWQAMPLAEASKWWYEAADGSPTGISITSMPLQAPLEGVL